jgi:C4-dicarboxylate-specific signal transduction histidine kinase
MRFLSNELQERQAIIERAYVEPLWNFDQVQIEEVSKSLLTNNDYTFLTAVRVMDPMGNVLFQTNNSKDQKFSFEEYAKRPFSKLGVSQVKKDGEVLGTVDVIFTSEGIMSQYRGLLSSIFLISLLIVSFTSVWIYFFMNRLLTHPLNKLLDHVKDLRNEQYEAKEYTGLSHELQLIANALNFTATLVKKRNDDLKNHSDNLERMVAERTSELENQILKNVHASRLVAVGEVASGIAHEINNPLMVINGQILKIKRQIKEGHFEEIEQPLSKISLMSERIVKIIKGLKLISRDGHKDPMNEFSFATMIEEIKLLTEMKIKSLDIDFSVNMPQTIDHIYGREVQISQVLVNLINNSFDAISAQEEKWIRIEVLDLNETIQVSVTDSGRGISKDLQDKIMNPFFTTKEVGKGTGLGLSISKGIIKDHGGDFYYNSHCPNTQFVFTISKSMAQQKAA